jgi:hypothetical protein
MNLDLGFDPTMHPAFDPVLVDRSPESSWHATIPINGFDPRITGFLNGLGITIPLAEVFYSLPGIRRPIHIDGNTMKDLCKLNWVYGGSGSKMRWWRPPPSGKGPIDRITSAGTKCITYEDEGCQVIWEASVGFPSLVQVGVPHDMVNSSIESRWCVSYVLYDRTTGNPLSWKQSVERFSPFMA